MHGWLVRNQVSGLEEQSRVDTCKGCLAVGGVLLEGCRVVERGGPGRGRWLLRQSWLEGQIREKKKSCYRGEKRTREREGGFLESFGEEAAIGEFLSFGGFRCKEGEILGNCER